LRRFQWTFLSMRSCRVLRSECYVCSMLSTYFFESLLEASLFCCSQRIPRVCSFVCYCHFFSHSNFPSFDFTSALASAAFASSLASANLASALATAFAPASSLNCRYIPCFRFYLSCRLSSLIMQLSLL
jgi:hypothetical protein